MSVEKRSAEVRIFPVAAHQFLNPLGLADLASRGKLPHVWLDVQHRRAVDCIEAGNLQRQTLDGQQAANRDANAVGPTLSPLREDADPGPFRAIARMTRSGLDFGLRHSVEEKHDFDVGKVGEAQDAVRRKLRGVEIDAAFDAAPNIVHGLYDRAVDYPDRAERNLLRHTSIVVISAAFSEG